MNINLNLIAIIGLYIAIFILIAVIIIKINKQIKSYKDMQKCNADSIRDTGIDLVNAEQKYTYRIETYFLKDIYVDENGIVNYALLQKDYLALFVKAINSIMNNVNDFKKHYYDLDELKSLKYRFYIYCLKFAKFSRLYDNYLNDLDMEYVVLEINNYYPEFNVDDRYFIDIPNIASEESKNIVTRIHIMDIIKKASILYDANYVIVNRCIYYKKCAY
jgi:hypothetical protein